MGNPLRMCKALSDSRLECGVPCVCPRCRTRVSGGRWNPQVDTPERTCPSGLEAANARAYEAGYRAAYAGYRDLSERYITELNKPRIRLGSVIGHLGAAGVGVLVGRVVP